MSTIDRRAGAGTEASQASPAPLLEGRGLSRRDPRGGDGWLLHEVSLRIEPAARLALTGPTGAGKSLLLRSLALLEPLDAGEVLCRGVAVHGAAVPAFRRRAVYVQQRPVLRACATRGDRTTVRACLELPFTLSTAAGRRFDESAALSALAALGRDAGLLDRAVDELSGGEAQIVALLRTIGVAPEVLLLDEPTASLDAASARAIETLVDRWLSEDGDAATRPRAVLWVTHDAAQAERVARRTLRLANGRLEEE